MGASLIGRECTRYLWYVFRWVHNAQFDGRQQRLFNRGHREEAQMIELLEGIGATVDCFDTSVPQVLHYRPESEDYFYASQFIPGDGLVEDVTGDAYHVGCAEAKGVYPDYPQHRVSGCEGHFGGSIDALLTLPEHYGIPVLFINEYKTQGTGAKFNNLVKNGVRVEKPDHFTQMSVYGFKKQVKYGVYMAVNKNDDSLHVEVVELDWALGERMEAKAHRIIFSRNPPQKLSESMAHSTCQYCDMKGVCHQSQPYEKNCRSCTHAQAIQDKQWGCNLHKQIIPKEFIAKGCQAWSPAI